MSLEKLDSLPLSTGAPHIVFVMVDDAGLNDMSLETSDQYVPTLQKLASEGVVLSRYYGMHLCTPARGAFLTGRWVSSAWTAHPTRLQ